MQAESSQAPRTALAAGAVVSVAANQATSPYLAAAPAGLFAPPAQSPVFDPASQPPQPQHLHHHHNQQPPPQPQSPFVAADAAFQHPAARPFQPLVQDPSASSHDAAYRVSAIPRTAQVIDYSNPYQQIDPHLHAHQQQPHPAQYHPHLYASTSYSSLTGAGPVSAFGPDLSSHPYAHNELGLIHPNVGNPMMRYNSFAMSADDMSRAGSSNGTPGPMTQQDIDNLLAMSRAQAGNYADASAFPCTYCDKVYTGKHARSIWRRHLQDKHNIPLSAQPRRTRWDGDVNRPKNAEERRARMLESKRRWARKKRLQEKQAAQAGKSGGSNTPVPDGSDDEAGDDIDDGADADVSSMSMSFSRSGQGDESLSMAQAEAHRRASLKAEDASQWDNTFFASHDEAGRPAKRQALAPTTSYNIAGPSTAPAQFAGQLPAGSFAAQEIVSGSAMYSQSPMRRPGLQLAPVSQPGPGLPLLANPNESFSSGSSDYSQPGSASFFNDSFGGNMSNAGSDTANTSIDTPATTWPALPPLDGAADKAALARSVEAVAGTEGQPRVQKGDTRDAAIQLLALRSGSNSPTEDREMSLRRRDANEDAPWSSTPSRGKAASEHTALTALSCSNAAETGRKNAGLDDVGLSPSPVSRTLASGAATVRAMPVTTPGPANRTGENPFSLDKHKISPYDGRRKLSYSGAPASPIASPTHLSFGGASMGKSLSSSSSTSNGPLGVKLPPLVSTPIRSSTQGHAEADGAAGERIRLDALPPLLGSASKKVGAPMMSTPFSKPMSGLGYSTLRRNGAGAMASGSNPHHALASSVRPSPSRHHSDDQFSSPQHLNLTESLGLAPHSISRTSSYASACYASSLGLTPSVANISGNLISGTPFHSGLGALSGLGGFTPLSTAKVAGGFWPESARKSACKPALLGAVGSPTVYKSTSSSSTTSALNGKRKHTQTKSRTASPVLVASKGDIFDADYPKPSTTTRAGPNSDDDDDDENLIDTIDTPSRPAVLRKLARTASGASHNLSPKAVERSSLGAIKLNH